MADLDEADIDHGELAVVRRPQKKQHATCFHEFGIEFVVSGAVVAEVEYDPKDRTIVKQVSLELDNTDRIDPAAQRRVSQHWYHHASEWPERRTAVFRGHVARDLGRVVEAALEVARPSYTRCVLQSFFNAALQNPNQSPYIGKGCSDFSPWYAREAALADMLNAMDARIAVAFTDELAEMYTNRRLGRSVIERGPRWDTHVPYVAAARRPKGADLDLPRAILTLYVYTAQIDSWAGGKISGDKTALRRQVLGLEYEMKAQFAKECGVALAPRWSAGCAR